MHINEILYLNDLAPVCVCACVCALMKQILQESIRLNTLTCDVHMSTFKEVFLFLEFSVYLNDRFFHFKTVGQQKDPKPLYKIVT